MSDVGSLGRAGPAGVPSMPSDERARLRKAAEQLEATFIQQMMKALRATVPQSETSAGSGQANAMFTDLLDQRVSEDLAGRMQRGLGEAIYRQLARDAGWSIGGDLPDVPTTGEDR